MKMQYFMHIIWHMYQYCRCSLHKQDFNTQVIGLIPRIQLKIISRIISRDSPNGYFGFWDFAQTRFFLKNIQRYLAGLLSFEYLLPIDILEIYKIVDPSQSHTRHGYIPRSVLVPSTLVSELRIYI